MGSIEDHATSRTTASASTPLPTSTPLKDLSPAWQGAGPAAFDLRSDTITTPTLSMLRAIEQCSLMDDVWREDPTTNDFQDYMAQFTGKESALLVLSGTMGNQVALRSLLTQPPHSILSHYRAHILTNEAGGCATLSQAQVNGIIPSNNLYLTLEDIQQHAILSPDIHYAPTRVIVLENTLNGTITPLSECQRISTWARSHNIKLHLDGARIWEAVAAGSGSLPAYLSCFDTAQLCFSKGLAAPIGSIIVGPAATIDHCRWIRKSLGGGIRQAGIITSAARIAVDEAFGTDPNGSTGKLRATHLLAKTIASLWTRLGGTLSRPTETNMVWLDLQHSRKDRKPISVEALVNVGKEEGIKLLGERLVVHWQVDGEEVLRRLERIFTRVLLEEEDGGGSEDVSVVGGGNAKEKEGDGIEGKGGLYRA